MKPQSPEQWRELCAEPHPGDGLPPHLWKKQESPRTAGNRRRGAHKTDQYCRAVQRILEAETGALLTDSGAILAVSPEGSGGALLVTVGVPIADPDDLAAREAALQSASGTLRAAVASGTHRKRTPHLRFRVVPLTD